MKGIIVASFGSTHVEAYENSIGSIARQVREKYPDYKVLESLSSEVVRSRLKDKGYDSLNFPMALEKMKEAGVDQLYVLMLYIIDGVEYEKVQKQGEEYERDMEILYTKPLLIEGLYEDLASRIEAAFDKPAILMGHGSYHKSDYHYDNLQEILRARHSNLYLGRSSRIYLGTVEGERELEDIMMELDKEESKDVVLSPFLLISGDHAKNDMADSDDPNSWYSILKDQGFDVEVDLRGLAQRPEICQIFMEKLDMIL